jgi:hypothetical protein
MGLAKTIYSVTLSRSSGVLVQTEQATDWTLAACFGGEILKVSKVPKKETVPKGPAKLA